MGPPGSNAKPQTPNPRRTEREWLQHRRANEALTSRNLQQAGEISDLRGRVADLEAARDHTHSAMAPLAEERIQVGGWVGVSLVRWVLMTATPMDIEVWLLGVSVQLLCVW